jgi:hypothetical protein
VRVTGAAVAELTVGVLAGAAAARAFAIAATTTARSAQSGLGRAASPVDRTTADRGSTCLLRVRRFFDGVLAHADPL